MALYDVITFDCYGTLIDWESGIVSAFESVARNAGVRLERAHILSAYARIEPVIEQKAYRPYREVLAETAAQVAQSLGWRLFPSEALFLAESLPDWPPFPDTNGALTRLKSAGCRLGILSNVDDDLLAATRRHFDVEFDLLVTAQQVRSYKPAPNHFLRARERIGGHRWLHAAQSSFHDIRPTTSLGIDNAWINRNGDRPVPGASPSREFTNLTLLADWVCGADANGSAADHAG
ncbi:MAG TPA: HAD-IA family hydrolase [Thermoanaerobaculia bacterium]|nr:HAD-IA family hydrolase [Thermoanaerobaculia bacterium]